MKQQTRWTARFLRWYLDLSPKKQEKVLKNLDQGRSYVWNAAKGTYVLKRS